MSITQLWALIKAGLVYAVNQTVGQMKTFLEVTVGEVEWVAIALGYPSPPVNFSGIVDQLTLLQSNVDTIETQILALGGAVTALGSPQQAGTPGVLPTSPPSGYGASDTATAVWMYTIPLSAISARDALAGAAAPGLLSSSYGQLKPAYFPAGWWVGGDWGFSAQPAPDNNLCPPLDESTILATDATPLLWINRVQPGWGVTAGEGGHPEKSQPGASWTWVWWMGYAEWAEYKAAAFGAPPASLNLPPIWPGVANVTFGSGVSLEAGVEQAGPLDGVEILITAFPPGSNQFDFDGEPSYRYLGALAFGNDDGSWETPQNLGMRDAIYMPKTMKRAANCRFRVKEGVTGAVYPFTINP